jgi:hypothetical protein
MTWPDESVTVPVTVPVTVIWASMRPPDNAASSRQHDSFSLFVFDMETLPPRQLFNANVHALAHLKAVGGESQTKFL